MHRFVDVTKLTEVERGNNLAFPPSSQLEYLVHGRYSRTEDDTKGVYGAWYVPLKELIATFGAEQMESELEAWESNLADARVEAFRAIADGSGEFDED